MITEEEDNDKIENLLTLNDMINNALAKYADIKRGLFDTHYEISGKPPTSNNPTEEPKQAISLIDLEDNTNSNQTSASNNNANVLDELSDIFGSSAAISSPAAQSVQNDIFGSGAITSPTTTAAASTKSITSGNSSSDLFDLLGQTNSNSAIASPSVHHANVPQATPSNALEQNSTTVTLVNKNGLHIELEINQVDTKYYVKAYFSNVSTAPMEKLMLKLAAPKSMQIKMEPQSSQTIQPKSNRLVTQNILLNNPNKEKLRLRYKVSYEQFGVEMELAGDYRS